MPTRSRPLIRYSCIGGMAAAGLVGLLAGDFILTALVIMALGAGAAWESAMVDQAIRELERATRLLDASDAT